MKARISEIRRILLSCEEMKGTLFGKKYDNVVPISNELWLMDQGNVLEYEIKDGCIDIWEPDGYLGINRYDDVRKYPFVGEYDTGMQVHFFRKGVGVVIKEGAHATIWKLGYFQGSWSMGPFVNRFEIEDVVYKLKEVN